MEEQFCSVRYYGLEVVTLSLRNSLEQAWPMAQVGWMQITVTLHFRRRMM